MNRRQLLSLLGASAAAPILPALPQAAPSAAAIANVNRYTYGLAVLHTRFQPGMTIAQIAERFRLTPAQAKTLAQRMVTDGHATHVGGTLRATDPVTKQRRHRPKAKPQHPKHAPLMAHLHQLCRDHGLTLSPRCALQEGFA